ncbi:MAG: FliH/SctL family protein [Oligoflexia bacterium]|nr:FliH/SctL family protein [Oligoflexia bacterium]
MSVTHFKTPVFDTLKTEVAETRVVKTQEAVTQSVQEFELQRLGGRHAMPSPRQRAQAESVHHDRFKMSQLAKEALGAEEQEKREMAEAIRKRVELETEAARAVGVKEGYVEGLEKGRIEAFERYRKVFDEKLNRLEEIVRSFETAKTAVFEANQKFLIDLSFRVGRSVLLRELSTDRDYVSRLARELLEKTELRENLTLKINPSDLALVDELKNGLQAEFGNLRNISVETSSEVRGGGAVLETEWGAIDAGIDTQLANLYAALQLSQKADG